MRDQFAAFVKLRRQRETGKCCQVLHHASKRNRRFCKHDATTEFDVNGNRYCELHQERFATQTIEEIAASMKQRRANQ